MASPHHVAFDHYDNSGAADKINFAKRRMKNFYTTMRYSDHLVAAPPVVAPGPVVLVVELEPFEPFELKQSKMFETD